MGFKISKIRLLETGYNIASWNMALDEVLMNSISESHEDDFPTLRIYGWSRPAVSIGYFQSMEKEVDVTKCKDAGIDVIRRITGGGAVLHDSELTYSFITRKYPQNIMESYRWICDVLVLCINNLGFDARFSPLNDIIVSSKKVSGSAQTRKKDTLMQHGTLLLDVNIEKMFSVLKVPSEKIRDKIITDVKDRVMGLNKTFDQVSFALKQAFSKKFDADISNEKVTPKEKMNAQIMSKQKYETYQWNWKR